MNFFYEKEESAKYCNKVGFFKAQNRKIAFIVAAILKIFHDVFEGTFQRNQIRIIIYLFYV